MKNARFARYRKAAFVVLLALSTQILVFANGSTKQKSTADAPSKDETNLVKARDAIAQGAPQKAITEYLDPIIKGFTEQFKGATKHVYSAQNQMQVIMYVALPDEKKVGTEVLDGTWANAYLMKAYALTELGKLKEAQQALESAIALSPMNSQYLSELGYTYQALKNCDKSIATYSQAASMAELGSDDTTKTADLTRAWRGAGYCLVEQGKLKEAEEMYEKSIALDPKDEKSKGELAYIRSLKK